MTATRILVTGSVRSGKSRHAEELLSGRATLTYVAPGPIPDPLRDPDWAERIRAHRARRPDSWTTLETADLAAALSTDDPVLVDCLGTWLTRLLDDAGLWEAPSASALEQVEAVLSEVAGAVDARTATTVLVTNEVGWGVVPSHRSGRLFRDLLGVVNQRLAAHCDEVHLVVAGRVLVL